MGEPGPIKSVQTSFLIIEHLVRNGGAGISELTKDLDVPLSTAHDHLSTLCELGYAVQNGTKYSASTRFLELAERKRNHVDLYGHARSIVDDLAEETGEHASLMIEENGYGVLIYTGIGANAVRLAPYAGTRLQLHKTAQGKAILAHFSRAHVEQILDDHPLDEPHARYGLPPKTEHTITDREVLFEELAEIREQGYALEEEELIDGLRSVGVPIITRDDTLHGAIGIHGPVSRISDEQVDDLILPHLHEARNVIEVNSDFS